MRLTIISSITLMIILLIACSDETSLGPSIFEEKESDSRGLAQQVDISYEVTESHSFQPIDGTMQDVCLLDLKILTIPPTTKSVSTTINGDGSFCSQVEGYNVTRTESKGNRPDYTISLCNGEVTYTDSTGTTKVDMTVDPGFIVAVTQTFGLNEEQKLQLFNQLMQEAEDNGAEVQDNGSSVTITTTNDDGSTTEIIYDKNAMAIVSSVTTDKSGVVTSKTVIVYTCHQDGTVTPKSIINVNLNQSTVCSPPVITQDILSFDNFQVDVY